MSSDRRSHPTVRPHALSLGVVVRPGTEARLSFLGPALAGEFATAMLLDTLGALSTFPVRHRAVFVHDGDGVLAHAKLPATWRRHAIATGAALGAAAFRELAGLGGEASLVVVGDGPVLPLGPLFDGLLALVQPPASTPGNLPPPSATPPEVSSMLLCQSDEAKLVALALVQPEAAIIERLPWDDAQHGIASLLAAAEAAKRPFTVTEPGYVVDSITHVRRLRADVAAGAFAPQCRRLLERADVATLLG